MGSDSGDSSNNSDSGNSGDDEEYHVESLRSQEEDEEFDAAFRDMMIGSIEAVKAHSHKTGDIDKMVIPTVLPKAKNITAPLVDEIDSDEEADDIDNEENSHVYSDNEEDDAVSEDGMGS